MDSKAERLDIRVVLAFAAVYIIWGSTYLGIYYAIQTWPPMILGAARFIIMGLLMYSYIRIVKKERLNAPLLRFGLVSGFLMFFIGNGAVILAEKHLPSGLVSIIAGTVPFWLLLLDKRSGSARFRNMLTWLGLIFGFGGVILLFTGRLESVHLDAEMIWSYIILIIGTLGWTTGTLYSKYHEVDGSILAKVSAQVLSAGLLFLLAAWIKGEFNGFSLAQVSTTSWMALWYLIFIGSMIGYFCYMWLLSRVSPHAVGTYAYVNPVVAVILGNVLAGETLSGRELIALFLITGGLMILYLSKKTWAPRFR